MELKKSNSIIIESPKNENKVFIFNQLGQKMFSGKIDSGNPFLTLVNLPEGIYFAVVLNQGRKTINTIKFYHSFHE